MANNENLTPFNKSERERSVKNGKKGGLLMLTNGNIKHIGC